MAEQSNRTLGKTARKQGKPVMELNRYGLARGQVPTAFNVGARAYDRLVGANPGYHRDLRASARRLGIGDGSGLRLLDAGCGTGASTAALLAVAPRARITAVDASSEMLTCARRKPWPKTVRFVQARIEELVEIDEHNGPFDAIFAAYLIRNLDDPDAQLRAFRGMLRPGARLAVHEYSVRDALRARMIWHAVCLGIIIPAGKLCTGDATLYRHLHRSVLAFDGAETFERRLRRAGFIDTARATTVGWQRDIVHTFLARSTADDTPHRGSDPTGSALAGGERSDLL